MRNLMRTWAALVLFGLAAGCAGTHSRWTGGGQQTLSPTAARTPDKNDLPPLESARVCLTTAQSMDREGRVADAIPLYVKARQLDPAQVSVCRRLAVLNDRTGDFTQANREYQEALRLAPRDATIYNDLGYSCYCQGRLKEAEKALRKAIEINPKMDRSWVNLGLVLAAQGHYADGLAAFEKAVPESQAHCNVAFIQTAQGKRAEAANSYRTALRLDPDLQLARGALAKLEAPATPRLEAPRPVEVVTKRPETPAPTTQPVVYQETAPPPVAVPPAPVSGPALPVILPAPAVPEAPAPTTMLPTTPQMPPQSAFPRLAEPTAIAPSGFTPMPWEQSPPVVRAVTHWTQKAP